MRKPRSSSFSIERLSEDILRNIPTDYIINVWTCRNHSNGLFPRIKDMLAARKVKGDVNHVTGDVHFLTFFLDPNRTVITIHDLVLLERLTGIKKWVAWLLWYWIPVHRSKIIITVSETTRTALLKSVRCDPAKVRVIHNSVSDEFQPAPEQIKGDVPRILQVGTGWNKNLERIVEALKNIPCQLVIIGRLSNKQMEQLQRLEVNYQNYFDLTREELLFEYTMANLVVFASLFEGFGLPIVEAQAIGRPVVTSNVSSMPEVAGGAACLVDPFDVWSIRCGIRRVIEDKQYAKSLVDAGFENVRKFRTTSVATRYGEIYHEIHFDSSR